MPGPASFAGKYPPLQTYPGSSGSNRNSADPFAGIGGPPGLYRGNLGGGPTLSADSINGGVGSYNPTGQRSDLASVLAGAQTKPAMVGGGNGWQPPNTGGQPWYGPGSPWGMARPGTDVSMSTGQIYYGPGSPWGETPPVQGPFTGYGDLSSLVKPQPGGVTAGPALGGGNFQKPGSGGKPSIGTAGGGGKPSIGYGGGPTRSMWK